MWWRYVPSVTGTTSFDSFRFEIEFPNDDCNPRRIISRLEVDACSLCARDVGEALYGDQ